MLSHIIFYIALAAIFTEAITELAVKSIIFSYPRNIVSSIGSFFKKLFSCGYCFSVWAAMAPATLSVVVCHPGSIIRGLVQWLIVWIIVHRLSNYIHNINDKYFDKYYSFNRNKQE